MKYIHRSNINRTINHDLWGTLHVYSHLPALSRENNQTSI